MDEPPSRGAPVPSPDSSPQGQDQVGAWHRFYDEQQDHYYFYNNDTGETQWEPPPGFENHLEVYDGDTAHVLWENRASVAASEDWEVNPIHFGGEIRDDHVVNSHHGAGGASSSNANLYENQAESRPYDVYQADEEEVCRAVPVACEQEQYYGNEAIQPQYGYDAADGYAVAEDYHAHEEQWVPELQVEDAQPAGSAGGYNHAVNAPAAQNQPPKSPVAAAYVIPPSSSASSLVMKPETTSTSSKEGWRGWYSRCLNNKPDWAKTRCGCCKKFPKCQRFWASTRVRIITGVLLLLFLAYFSYCIWAFLELLKMKDSWVDADELVIPSLCSPDMNAALAINISNPSRFGIDIHWMKIRIDYRGDGTQGRILDTRFRPRFRGGEFTGGFNVMYVNLTAYMGDEAVFGSLLSDVMADKPMIPLMFSIEAEVTTDAFLFPITRVVDGGRLIFLNEQRPEALAKVERNSRYKQPEPPRPELLEVEVQNFTSEIDLSQPDNTRRSYLLEGSMANNQTSYPLGDLGARSLWKLHSGQPGFNITFPHLFVRTQLSGDPLLLVEVQPFVFAWPSLATISAYMPHVNDTHPAMLRYQEVVDKVHRNETFIVHAGGALEYQNYTRGGEGSCYLQQAINVMPMAAIEMIPSPHEEEEADGGDTSSLATDQSCIEDDPDDDPATGGNGTANNSTATNSTGDNSTSESPTSTCSDTPAPASVRDEKAVYFDRIVVGGILRDEEEDNALVLSIVSTYTFGFSFLVYGNIPGVQFSVLLSDDNMGLVRVAPQQISRSSNNTGLEVSVDFVVSEEEQVWSRVVDTGGSLDDMQMRLIGSRGVNTISSIIAEYSINISSSLDCESHTSDNVACHSPYGRNTPPQVVGPIDTSEDVSVFLSHAPEVLNARIGLNFSTWTNALDLWVPALRIESRSLEGESMIFINSEAIYLHANETALAAAKVKADDVPSCNVTEWGPWSDCENRRRYRYRSVVSEYDLSSAELARCPALYEAQVCVDVCSVDSFAVSSQWQTYHFSLLVPRPNLIPVVVPSIVSDNNKAEDAVIVRIKDVTSTSFRARLFRWNGSPSIKSEDVSFLVCTPGKHSLDRGAKRLEVGQKEISPWNMPRNGLLGWKNVTFEMFKGPLTPGIAQEPEDLLLYKGGRTPLLLGHVQTYNGGDYIQSRVSDVSEFGANVGIEVADLKATYFGPSESVGYIAMDLGLPDTQVPTAADLSLSKSAAKKRKKASAVKLVTSWFTSIDERVADSQTMPSAIIHHGLQTGISELAPVKVASFVVDAPTHFCANISSIIGAGVGALQELHSCASPVDFNALLAARNVSSSVSTSCEDGGSGGGNSTSLPSTCNNGTSSTDTDSDSTEEDILAWRVSKVAVFMQIQEYSSSGVPVVTRTTVLPKEIPVFAPPPAVGNETVHHEAVGEQLNVVLSEENRTVHLVEVSVTSRAVLPEHKLTKAPTAAGVVFPFLGGIIRKYVDLPPPKYTNSKQSVSVDVSITRSSSAELGRHVNDLVVEEVPIQFRTVTSNTTGSSIDDKYLSDLPPLSHALLQSALHVSVFANFDLDQLMAESESFVSQSSGPSLCRSVSELSQLLPHVSPMLKGRFSPQREVDSESGEDLLLSSPISCRSRKQQRIHRENIRARRSVHVMSISSSPSPIAQSSGATATAATAESQRESDGLSMGPTTVDTVSLAGWYRNRLTRRHAVAVDFGLGWKDIPFEIYGELPPLNLSVHIDDVEDLLTLNFEAVEMPFLSEEFNISLSMVTYKENDVLAVIEDQSVSNPPPIELRLTGESDSGVLSNFLSAFDFNFTIGNATESNAGGTGEAEGEGSDDDGYEFSTLYLLTSSSTTHLDVNAQWEFPNISIPVEFRVGEISLELEHVTNPWDVYSFMQFHMPPLVFCTRGCNNHLDFTMSLHEEDKGEKLSWIVKEFLEAETEMAFRVFGSAGEAQIDYDFYGVPPNTSNLVETVVDEISAGVQTEGQNDEESRFTVNAVHLLGGESSNEATIPCVMQTFLCPIKPEGLTGSPIRILLDLFAPTDLPFPIRAEIPVIQLDFDCCIHEPVAALRLEQFVYDSSEDQQIVQILAIPGDLTVLQLAMQEMDKGVSFLFLFFFFISFSFLSFSFFFFFEVCIVSSSSLCLLEVVMSSDVALSHFSSSFSFYPDSILTHDPPSPPHVHRMMT